MSNLCSRIASKPPKRLPDGVSVTQTYAWMNGETCLEISIYSPYSKMNYLFCFVVVRPYLSIKNYKPAFNKFLAL